MEIAWSNKTVYERMAREKEQLVHESTTVLSVVDNEPVLEVKNNAFASVEAMKAALVKRFHDNITNKNAFSDKYGTAEIEDDTLYKFICSMIGINE
jgi:hypothetical protein